MSDRALPTSPDAIAPDGSEVRILSATSRGSMAHFKLFPGQVSRAIVHRSVEELWYVIAGQGSMWRKTGAHDTVLPLQPGQSLTIPLGTHFQFRCDGETALEIVGVTMPPWPGEDEAVFVSGKW